MAKESSVSPLQQNTDKQPAVYAPEIIQQRLKRKNRIKELIDRMTKKSSIHGVYYLSDRRYPTRRLIWLFTTCLAFAYCTHKVYESTVKYLSYPVTTSIRRQYVSNLTFPAVTICNLNDMRFR